MYYIYNKKKMEIQFQYDEDLSRNPFLQKLQSEHKIILDTAPLENWIICIPRLATIKSENLTNPDFLLSHILIPNDELPDTHFTNLLGKDINIVNNKLTSQKLNIESTVLFEEVYYTKGLLKYKVWCIEHPLFCTSACDNDNRIKSITNIKTNDNQQQLAAASNLTSNTSTTTTPLLIIRDLNDAVELIKNETENSKVIFRKIENACNIFIKNNQKLTIQQKTIQQLKKSIQLLLKHCLQSIMFLKRIQEKCQLDQQFYKILKISLETYIMNYIYEYIFDVITINYLDENERFNRILRQLSDVHLSDFHIDQKHHDVITCVRVELIKIENYTTVIDKLGCLSRALNSASRIKHINLSVDELIPILVFVIVKSNLTHWITTLQFLKEFIFNEITIAADKGAESFLITQLEAAITYINSITDFVIKPYKIIPPPAITINNNNDILHNFQSRSDFINYLFQLIIDEKENAIIQIFKQAETNGILTQENSHINNDDNIKTLCHPLCNCEKCSEKIEQMKPTINIQNINGLSAIHIPAIYGLPKMLNLLLALNINLHLSDENKWTALHFAAAKGHQNILLLLLHAGADINAKTSDKLTPLHLAAWNGHNGCVKAILYYSDHMNIFVDKNAQNKFDDTPLHLAVKWGFMEIIETLLEYGAKIDCVNRLGYTVFDYVHNSLIKTLFNSHVVIDRLPPSSSATSSSSSSSSTTSSIDISPSTSTQSSSSQTQNQNKLFRGFIKSDSNNGNYNNNNNNNNTGNTITNNNNSNNNNNNNNKNKNKNENIHNPILNKTNSISNHNSNNNNKQVNDKIIAAIRNHDTKLAFYFLELNNNKSSALEVSIESHPLKKSSSSSSLSSSSSQELIPYNINEYNTDGLTPLHIAIECSNIEIIKYLLLENKNILITLTTKFTTQNILHIAIEQYHHYQQQQNKLKKHQCFDIVELIMTELSKPIIIEIVNHQDVNGDTPLHYGIRYGDIQIVKLLLNFGHPNINLKNNDNKTPYELAKFYMFFNIIKLFDDSCNNGLLMINNNENNSNNNNDNNNDDTNNGFNQSSHCE